MPTIRQLEELTLNALPTLETLHYDGWLLRLAGGYPRRANSIQLLYPSLLPLEEKIAYCEAQYTARGIKTVFKLTAAAPRELESLLKARGYVEDSVTAVQMLDLAGVDPALTSPDVLIEPRLTDSWLVDYARMNDLNPTRAATMRAILATVPRETAFIRLRRDGETAALGLGVVDQGWIGLYDVVTDRRVRRQGHGRALLLNLLKWGKARGAHQAYLQVMLDNAPALALYAGLGFNEAYRYWYIQNSL